MPPTGPETDQAKNSAAETGAAVCSGKYSQPLHNIVPQANNSSSGPHKCIRHGRSLKISCRGDDGNCPSEFSKRNDFNRHCGSVHRGDRAEAPVERLIDCPFAGCDRVREKGFKRKDNLTQHRRNVHEERIVKNPIRFGRNNDAA